MKNLQELLSIHAALLENNAHAYFELAYTRTTGWMAWICTNCREADPNRKVLASGQGATPEEAAGDALDQLMREEPYETNQP